MHDEYNIRYMYAPHIDLPAWNVMTSNVDASAGASSGTAALASMVLVDCSAAAAGLHS